jgi:hypothetical protein
VQKKGSKKGWRCARSALDLLQNRGISTTAFDGWRDGAF